MNDFNRSLGTLSIIAIIACSACAQEDNPSDPDLWSETMTDNMHALSAVACHPREEDSCGRGEACLAIGEDRQGDPILHLCASGRCDTQDDCGQGYLCRADHCIAVERDQPERGERDGEETERGERERGEREEAERGERERGEHEETERGEREREETERGEREREETERGERERDGEETERGEREREETERGERERGEREEQARRGGIDLKIASRVVVEPTRRRGAYNVTVAVESLNHSTFENLWFEISLKNGRNTLSAARRPAPIGRDALLSRVRFENVPLPEGSFISVDPLNLVDETNERNNTIRVAP